MTRLMLIDRISYTYTAEYGTFMHSVVLKDGTIATIHSNSDLRKGSKLIKVQPAGPIQSYWRTVEDGE